MDPQSSPGDLPRSSVTTFDLGYRPGNHSSFLDQVDMGINLGGLVQPERLSAELAAERDQHYGFLNRLRLSHDAAELDLEDFISEEENLEDMMGKVQAELSDHAKRVRDAYARSHLNAAMGLELAHKDLRVNLSVRLRDLNQKALELMTTIKETQKKLSEIELDTIRTNRRLHVINSQLRPINNLADALNA